MASSCADPSQFTITSLPLPPFAPSSTWDDSIRPALPSEISPTTDIVPALDIAPQVPTAPAVPQPTHSMISRTKDGTIPPHRFVHT